MRTFITLLLTLTLGAPLFAQDEKPAEPAKEPAKEQPKEEPKKDAEPQMLAEAKKLYEDFLLVYAEYYRLVLEKIKANDPYKADEVWDAAVKTAQNAKYKDRTEFFDAVTKMKAKDRIFKKQVNDQITKFASDHTDAVKKWREAEGK
jgi:hypothetical protein